MTRPSARETADTPNVTLGPLEPGLYVIETERELTDSDATAWMDRLTTLAPECRFIILDRGTHIARTEPAEAADRLTL